MQKSEAEKSLGFLRAPPWLLSPTFCSLSYFTAGILTTEGNESDKALPLPDA